MKLWIAVLIFVPTVLLLEWAWYFHCCFLFHVWDTSRRVTDICLRCGALRFKR